MDSEVKLKKLQEKMKDIYNQLSTVCDNLTKVEESNSYAINVNGNVYKAKELASVKSNLQEQMRIIKHNILPSLEKELKK